MRSYERPSCSPALSRERRNSGRRASVSRRFRSPRTSARRNDHLGAPVIAKETGKARPRVIRLAAIAFLLVLSGSAGAQIAAPSGQQELGRTNGPPSSSSQNGASGSGQDVTCNELISGTFCTSGRSRAGGYGSPTAGTSATHPSLPPCIPGMPANELCN